jgi:hypothetical protein
MFRVLHVDRLQERDNEHTSAHTNDGLGIGLLETVDNRYECRVAHEFFSSSNDRGRRVTIVCRCSDVQFQSNGRTILKATTWVGYAGILTGMRLDNGYSVSVNFRHTRGTLTTNLKTALTR